MARSRSRPQPIVRFARIEELKVFEISEADLDKLEAGPAGQLHLNFALALLPTSLSILVTLLTTTIESTRLYIAFHVAFWALFIQGAISLLRWIGASRSYRDVIAEIRSRMPIQPVEAEQIAIDPPARLESDPSGE